VWQKLRNYQETNYLRWNAFTAVGVLLIIICGIKVSYNLDQYMDLLFWDESLYLLRGYRMFPYIPRDWGPSYSLWYKILSLFITDKVALYYFNFKFTTILLSISFFLLLLSCGVQRVLAFILGIFSLSAFLNLPVWPHVSHFCVIVLIAGIIVAKYQQTLVSKLVICSLALMVCSYSRPEVFLAFFAVLAFTYLFFLLNIKQATKKDIILMLVLTGTFAFIYKFFKTPFNNGDSMRSIGVFLQHFALNYNTWYPSDAPFWLEFPSIIQKHFGGAITLKGIIAANPELLERHFMSNTTLYFSQLGKMIISFFAPVFTKTIHWLCLMVCIMLFATYFSVAKKSKSKFRRLLALLKSNIFTILVLMIFAFPSVIVCIYAYPRDHYLLLQVPFLLLVSALIISCVTVEIIKPIQKIIVVGVIWFFVMPVAEDFTYFNLFRKEESLANLKTVNYLTKKFEKTTDSVRIFDVEGGLSYMLPNKFTEYNHYYLWRRDSIKMSDFILSHNIDIIYKTPTLTDLNSVKTDTILFDLLKNPEKYGYYNQKTGDFAPYLLIKKK